MTTQAPPRTWVIELPPGTEIRTANDRGNVYALNAVTQALKTLMVDLVTKIHKLPRIERAYIVVEYQPPPKRKQDRHPLASKRIEDQDNLAPTAKALVDGLVKAGVLPGDSRKRVRSELRLLAETHPRGLVRVRITEVTDGHGS